MHVEDITRGFAERMRNIVIFAPLLELQQKTKYPYPLMEIGFATLLCILECMISGEFACTYEKVARFLREVLHTQYNSALTPEEALEFAHYLVREGLMNDGQPFAYSFMDYETGKSRTYQFHLIELESYSIKDKIVHLRLSSEGLELLFKTREMLSEIQVSISQLYLRQQILKGVFDDALHTADELALAVRNEKKKLRNLEEKIIRDVLTVAREKEFEREMAQINYQLQHEREVFKELELLVDETMEQYASGDVGEKERKAIDSVFKIRQKLHEIIIEHEGLFTDKIAIQKLMNLSFEAAIINAFGTKINFETEILTPLMHRNVSLEILQKIINPMLLPHWRCSFHPAKALSEQYLRRLTNGPTLADLWEMDEESVRKEEEQERKFELAKEKEYYTYLCMLLQPLAGIFDEDSSLLDDSRRWKLPDNSTEIVTDNQPEPDVGQTGVYLSQILNNVRQNQPEIYWRLINELDFYPFIIQLHQLGVVPLYKKGDLPALTFDALSGALVLVAENYPEIYQLHAFELVALNTVIHLPNGYALSDFLLRRVPACT